MILKDAAAYVDLANKALTSLAILIAAGWALWRFVLHREAVWNLLLQVSAKVVAYNKRRSLLLLKVTLKNIGRVKIMPGAKGCCVSVSQLPKNCATGSVIQRSAMRCILSDVDVLRHYRRNGGYPRYVIEPSCEYHEYETLVVVPGSVPFFL